MSRPCRLAKHAALVLAFAAVAAVGAIAIPSPTVTGATLHFLWDVRGEIEIPDSTSDGGSGQLDRWATLAAVAHDSGAVLIDLGNSYFPGFLSRYSNGSFVSDVLKITGIRVKCLGHHDFLSGIEALRRLREHAPYQFACANLVDKQSGSRVFDPAATLSVAGLKVVLVPVLDPEFPPGMRVPGRETFAVTDPVAAVRRTLAEHGAGADLKILLSERRVIDKYPAILAVSGIDVIVCGDQASGSARDLRESTYADGKRVFHVPGFHHGTGMLALGSSGTVASARFSVCDSLPGDPDSVALGRLKKLRAWWWNLYRSEHTSNVVSMDTPLKGGQREIVGNLLREWSGCEVACFEPDLVTKATLPASIGLHDLDRLLTGAPDLVTMRVAGRALGNLHSNGLLCVGVDRNRIGGRPVSRNELYSVVITESAFGQVREKLRGSVYGVRHRYTSVFEAVATQLANRKRSDYDFRHLDHRWRLLVDPSFEAVVRQLSVENPDSIKALSGVSYAPFRSWDLNLRAPVSFYNALNRLDLSTKLEYATSGENVGRNNLETRVDYSYGTSPVLNPYASSTYQSYVKLKDGEAKPARFRSTVGTAFSPPGWRLKIGAGAGRSVVSSLDNPFGPLRSVFADTGQSWGPAIEVSADGSYSVDQLLRKWKVQLAPYQELRFGVQGEAFFSSLTESPLAEHKLNFELTAAPASRVRLKLGFRTYYAYLTKKHQYFYNLEPSFTVLGTYPLKW